ncbi:protocadherin Fat 4 [Elysia marginata]|uniref:Protocadherin Fat 4 n=1 Tax=Elysia marginata TaxID=1093978 RepID=A0AAV4IZI0_9GAST|nr:protocadherin Fat 4 [Elysia marginata]
MLCGELVGDKRQRGRLKLRYKSTCKTILSECNIDIRTWKELEITPMTSLTLEDGDTCVNYVVYRVSTKLNVIAVLKILHSGLEESSSAQIQFSPNQLAIQISEDTQKGTKFFQFTVTGDGPLDIKPLTNVVTINTTTQSDGSLIVDVYLNTDLDRDYGKDSYDLSFQATDSKTTKPFKPMLIVKDVNDEIPQWKDRPYSVSVKENAEINKIIYIIAAFDRDLNDELIYTLSTDEASPFSLSKNGTLLLVSALDFEKQSFYQYTATVTVKLF